MIKFCLDVWAGVGVDLSTSMMSYKDELVDNRYLMLRTHKPMTSHVLLTRCNSLKPPNAKGTQTEQHLL